MGKNVGRVDKTVRIVLGLVLLIAALFSGLALFDSTLIKSLAVVAGAVLIVTAVTSFCPLYRLLGVQTCKVS